MSSPTNRQHRWMPRSLELAIILACLGLFVPRGFTQAPPEQVQLIAGPSYTSGDGNAEPRFPNVDLVFDLKGSTHSIIPRPDDLRLYSLGRQIGTASSIRTFAQTGYGMTAILALDVSDSMKGEPLDTIHASVARFVSQARAQDRIAVLTFADHSEIDVPFGAGQSTLANKPKTVETHGRFPRLYDGIFDALSLFTNSQPRRRQLLIIADGHDQDSHHTITEVILRAISLGVVIDSIELPQESGEHPQTLRQLSFETGGTYLRPQSALHLETLIDQNIEAKRATPVATFRLQNIVVDGKLLSAQLRWQPGGLSATAFIQTPQGKHATKVMPSIFNLWLWGLSGCFVIGVILFVLSLRGVESFPAPQSSPSQSATLASNSIPAPRSGSGPVSVPIRIQEHSHFDNESRRSGSEAVVHFNAPPGGPFARLLVKNGNLAGQRIPVTTTEFSIGGVQGNNLLIPGDTTISGQHLRLYWNNATLHIEDNNSTNGTYLNQQRLPRGRHLLKPGDMIGLGRTIVIVEHA